MKFSLTIICIFIFLGCIKLAEVDIDAYHELINSAELSICKHDFKSAIAYYNKAFGNIEKPFGKDVFNAALSCQQVKLLSERDKFLQILVNNLDDLEYVKSVFIPKYISKFDWKKIVNKQQIQYSPSLRKEFKNIRDRDQLFRPNYETHDDTINYLRKLNLNRIFEVADSIGFPSHLELGYTEYLAKQNLDIVLLHTAQRRSYDKTVYDLERILYAAVQEGRFDPENAINIMQYQNDLDKGVFKVFSTWQYIHPLLPDSLNSKIWIDKISAKRRNEINQKRKEWKANSIEDISIKSAFLAQSELPFIFTSVHKSTAYLKDDFDKETALKNYEAGTLLKEEYKFSNN